MRCRGFVRILAVYIWESRLHAYNERYSPSSMSKHHIQSFAILSLTLLCAGCQTPQTPEPVTSTGSVALPQPKLVLDEKTLPSINDEGIILSHASNRREVLSFLGASLSDAETSYLEKNKFLLLPVDRTSLATTTRSVNFDGMLKAFDAIQGSGLVWERKPENAKFVNPDVVLHAYHRFFEQTLEQLEKTDLFETLSGFLDSMVEGSLELAKSGDVETKERGRWISAQLITAKILLGNSLGKPDFFPSPDDEAAWMESERSADSYENAAKMVPEMAKDLPLDMQQRIKDELKLVYEASAVEESPLFNQYKTDVSADYTQYTPRSHYTKSSVLRSYFRTMMYLGRNSYFLKEDIGVRDATLVTSLLDRKPASGATPRDSWNKIMDITGFYAGQSDDLTLKEWDAYVSETLKKTAGQSTASDTDTLGANISKLRLPKVLSDVIVNPDIADKTKDDLLRDTLAVRVFGQRFTFDAWVLNQLTAGDEMTKPKLPSTPSALFVNAALGGERAESHIPRFLKDTAQFTDEESDALIAKLSGLRDSLKKVREDEWFSSLGTAWTYVLSSLTNVFGKGYPAYMQSGPFADKQIETFLGSYAELKHDTLLYAKQSYAELGAGGPDEQTPPPVPKGFVEPNLPFWNRILQLVAKQKDLFTRLNLLTDTNAQYRLQQFEDTLAFYGSLAQKELAGTSLTEEEYERLRTTNIAYIADPIDMSVIPDEESGKTELIADIHTDAKKGQILYEATGRPYVMLALVGNESSPRLAIGLAYNHYEFTAPLGGNRLTDESWKNTVYNEPQNMPVKNFWYDSLLAK